MKITLDLPSELAAQLQPHRSDAALIVAAGLRDWRRTEDVLKTELERVMQKLSGPPAPEAVLALRLSKPAQTRVEALAGKRHAGKLSRAEQKEWRYFEMTEHLVRMAKIEAAGEVGVPRAA